MSDTSSLYVTPPTIFLPNIGFKFSLISSDPEWIQDTLEELEKSFHTKLTFYYTEGEETAEHLTWQLLYMPLCDFVLVDSHALTMGQTILATAYMQENNVWFCCDEDTDETLMVLLNSLDAKLYGNIEHLLEHIKDKAGV